MVRFLCLFIFGLMSAAGLSQTATEYYNMAKRAELQLDYPGAVKMMNEAVELEPENINYLVYRGELYLELEKYNKARTDFETGMSLDSMDINPRIGRSRYFLYLEMPDSALHEAQLAYILSETSYDRAKATSAIAESYQSMGEDTMALRYFNESLVLDTTNINAYKKAALILMTAKNYDEANDYLRKAYQYDKRDLEILINLAYTYNKVGEYMDAVEYCNIALSLDPDQPLALSNRAFAYLHLDQTEKALEDIDQSIKNDNRNPLAYRYKGEILMALQERDKACKNFEKAEKYGYASLYDDDVQELIRTHCE